MGKKDKKKKKKLKGDQIFTSGYIDFVPGSDQFDSSAIRKAVDEANEQLRELSETNHKVDWDDACAILREKLGLPDPLESVKYFDPVVPDTLEGLTVTPKSTVTKTPTDKRLTLQLAGDFDIHDFTKFMNPPVESESDDSVNHPTHYTRGKIEVIEFIEEFGLDKSMHLGNAAKYICRAGFKDPNKYNEDLDKAIWYIKRTLSKIYDNKDYVPFVKNPNSKYDIVDFSADQGLPFHLSMALFYICYCVSSEDYVKYLKLAIDHLNLAKENARV